MRLLCTYRCLSRKLSSSPLSLDSLLSLSHSTWLGLGLGLGLAVG